MRPCRACRCKVDSIDKVHRELIYIIQGAQVTKEGFLGLIMPSPETEQQAFELQTLQQGSQWRM